MKKLICVVLVISVVVRFVAWGINQNIFNNSRGSSLDFVAHYLSGLRGYDDYDAAKMIADMFDDYFFAENFLVFFELRQPSTALDYRISSVRANGDIVLRPKPRGGAGRSISHWTIVIELNNDFVPQNFNVIFDEKYTHWWSENPIPVQIIQRDGTPPNIITRQVTCRCLHGCRYFFTK